MAKKKVDVGRSSRTPNKHYLLNAALGKICGVLSLDRTTVPCRITSQQPLIMVDMCGGDGLKNEQHDCSPMIMFSHCDWLSKRGKRCSLEVIEQMANTFEQLESNCGWMPKEIVTLTHGNSAEYRLPRLTETQPAFIHCDPNTVDQIPLSRPFISGFNRYTTYLVTLGCNVGGAMRTPIEKRHRWFDYVKMVIEVLPRHHDAVLFWLNKDDSKWAYLLSIPTVWSKDFTVKAVDNTSKIWTKGVSAVSYRSDRMRFNDQVTKLFLTKEEYANRTN